MPLDALDDRADVDSDQLLDEIREANLTYLMLAQHMIRKDHAQALYRLGVDGELADLIASLTPGQVLKMASSNVLLARFRFDERRIWDLLSSHARDRQAGIAHAHILIAGDQAVESVN